ncbi:MAG: SprT-like domain-containing protein [Candidatus Nanoarchaeia archaeon]
MLKIDHSGIAREAFMELFPLRIEDRKMLVKYSSKFRGYNANVRYSSREIVFSLSRDWLELSDELKKGLIQHLLVKVFKKEDFEKTIEMDLYEKFITNLGKYAHIEEQHDEELEKSFTRLNKEYFEEELERPNLIWGQDSFRKLGHYEYATNTIMISNIFKGEPKFLDYIMYHEMIHKKQGRKITKSGRSIHHDAKFRAEEAKYKNNRELEDDLKSFIRRKRLKNAFKWW